MTTESQEQDLSHNTVDELSSSNRKAKDFLTVLIADQSFCIPILQVQDVLRTLSVTQIPLSPPEVAGSLNLRGRIVTAINVRQRLSLPQSEDVGKNMSVVVEHDNELYSLIIDSVGDVMALKDKDFQSNPATLDSKWKDVSAGIYRLDDELLVILDVPRLLDSVH
jgi:purine-binding chemotaxis protein CheW